MHGEYLLRLRSQDLTRPERASEIAAGALELGREAAVEHAQAGKVELIAGSHIRYLSPSEHGGNLRPVPSILLHSQSALASFAIPTRTMAAGVPPKQVGRSGSGSAW